jgi:hypothetical protein
LCLVSWFIANCLLPIAICHPELVEGAHCPLTIEDAV